VGVTSEAGLEAGQLTQKGRTRAERWPPRIAGAPRARAAYLACCVGGAAAARRARRRAAGLTDLCRKMSGDDAPRPQRPRRAPTRLDNGGDTAALQQVRPRAASSCLWLGWFAATCPSLGGSA
jgi:hypothetical protein